MSINAILAHDDFEGIGKDGALPWPHNTADMKWFRDCTLNHVVVMGRKTWESLDSTRLVNRVNIVVTSQEMPSLEEGGPDHVLSSENGWLGLRDELTDLMKNSYPDKKLWVIGGASIYDQLIPICDNIYLTNIPGDYGCDTFVSLGRHLANFTFVTKKEQDGLTFSIWKRI